MFCVTNILVVYYSNKSTEYIVNKLLKLILHIVILITLLNCGSYKSDLNTEIVGVIPKPVSVNLGNNQFVLKEDTKIYYGNGSDRLKFSGIYLAEYVKQFTGLSLEVLPLTASVEGGIRLIKKNIKRTDEGYNLRVNENFISITSANDSGVFYGVQTLIQMVTDKKTIVSCSINDYPRFKWRGTMLDVSRHFFDVQDIKRYIDLIALYKINTLHLHLTDDQGWRIMIDSWPELAKYGGSTQVGGGEGGYYTKSDYKEIVTYAAERFITIVPEIDMPGHTNAALASYAELNPDGIKKELYTGIDVGFSTLDIDKELTYQFVDDVIRELAEITPGKYIHIGGDEAIVNQNFPGGKMRSELRKDYVKFINRVEKIVNSYGKTMIGWEDVDRADLDKTSILQIWHLNAKNTSQQVILSPAEVTYLDMKYNDNTELGLSWAGLINLEKGYSWDPYSEFSNINEDQILGVEAPLWSETLTTIDDIEFMAFPRLAGYAEIGWSRKKDRIFEGYINRLEENEHFLEKLGVNFYRSPYVNRD